MVPNRSEVEDPMVGIEVADPAGQPFTFRTRPTGMITTRNWAVNFTQLYTCNSNGVPKYSFQPGEAAWVYVKWENFDQGVAHPVEACIAFYDANSVPVGIWDFSSGVPQTLL